MEPITRMEYYLQKIAEGTADPSKPPLVLYAGKAEEYNTIPAYGDKALKAIQEGRPILVHVPNADGGNYTAIYSPVLMYQLPNYQNNYLYLFYLRDEKQDLSALLGQAEGTVQMPQYGELQMLLSQEYNGSPLGQPYIGQSRPAGSAAGVKPVFLISGEDGYGAFLAYLGNPERKVTAQELADMYFAGNGYFTSSEDGFPNDRISGVFTVSSNSYVSVTFGISNNEIEVTNISEFDFKAAMAKYLP